MCRCLFVLAVHCMHMKVVPDLDTVIYAKLRIPYPCKRVVKRYLRQVYKKRESFASKHVRPMSDGMCMRCVFVR